MPFLLFASALCPAVSVHPAHHMSQDPFARLTETYAAAPNACPCTAPSLEATQPCGHCSGATGSGKTFTMLGSLTESEPSFLLATPSISATSCVAVRDELQLQ